MMFGLSCCIQVISILGEGISGISAVVELPEFVDLILLSDPNLRNITSHSICVAMTKYETS